jgi:hypothetical protein
VSDDNEINQLITSKLKELTKENSLSQEYLASLVDSYYGLWGAWTESNSHGMWGIYIAKTREEKSGGKILEDISSTHTS